MNDVNAQPIWPTRWETNFQRLLHPHDWDAQLREAFPDGVPADVIICKAIEKMAHARGTYGDYPGCQDLISSIRKQLSASGPARDPCNHCRSHGWRDSADESGHIEQRPCICDTGRKWYLKYGGKNWTRYRRRELDEIEGRKKLGVSK